VDYFFWLNDSTATIKLVKAQASINASKTVMQHHPLSGIAPTTFEKSVTIAFSL
jgi:hypothetical protein